MIYEDLCKSTFENPILSVRTIKLTDISNGKIGYVDTHVSLANTVVYCGKLDKEKDYPVGSIVIDDEGTLFIRCDHGFEVIPNIEPSLASSY